MSAYCFQKIDVLKHPWGMYINKVVGGTKLYEIGYGYDKIYQYTFTTPWDLSTCSYDGISISTKDSYPQGLYIKPDGTKLYEIGYGNDKICQYTFTTPWDLSTCSYDGISISTKDTNPTGLFIA